jgi:hypothetical protein
MIVDPAVARRKFERDVRPLVDNPDLYTRLGIRSLAADYPILRVALVWQRRQLEIGIELIAPDWDYRPPSARWVALDGQAWPATDAPSGNGFQGPHPETGAPWLCFRGCLEYHEWESHASDAWWPLRLDERYRLLGFVQNVATVLRRT